jgi:hypothetical protein
MKERTFKATNGPGEVCHLPLFRLLVEKFGADKVPDIRSDQRNEKPETTFFIKTKEQ